MKKIFPILTITALGLIFVPKTILAEDGGLQKHGEHLDPSARLQMLTDKLGLTQDQQAKVKAIFEQDAPAFKEIMSKGHENLTADEKVQLKELMQAHHAAVSAILTPDQQAKFNELRGPRGHKPTKDASGD